MSGYALSGFKKKCCNWEQKKQKQLKWMKCTAVSIKKTALLIKNAYLYLQEKKRMKCPKCSSGKR
ncbi:hypothetical protein Barb4_05096 [Bacteroidales bacterium Barb4]|nr:hypothetical protein Barb4_05096 [Bacteroidales bacterium Barb4]